MNTVFIYNRRAGKQKSKEAVAFANALEDKITYTTKKVGDAYSSVKDYCEKNGPARFVSCGGDGTLGEVLNGIMQYEGCELALIPLGTGNDFCRNFTSCTLEDVNATQTTLCDALKCTLTLGGKQKVVYSANMVNIGFDCNAAHMTSSMKKKPFVSGTLAYVLAVFATLIKKEGASLTIEADGKCVHKGELLLTTAANGSFCGGGFMSNPNADVADGFVDVNIIKNVSRTKFVSLLPSYKKGTFLNKKGIEKVVSNFKCKNIKFDSPKGSFKVCIDGEIHEADQLLLEVIPHAFAFVGQRKQKSV